MPHVGIQMHFPHDFGMSALTDGTRVYGQVS
jgi:hypothetical protein